jgi:hypothetical protein
MKYQTLEILNDSDGIFVALLKKHEVDPYNIFDIGWLLDTRKSFGRDD